MIENMYLPKYVFCLNLSIGRLNMDLKIIIGQNTLIIGFIENIGQIPSSPKYRTSQIIGFTGRRGHPEYMYLLNREGRAGEGARM